MLKSVQHAVRLRTAARMLYNRANLPCCRLPRPRSATARASESSRAASAACVMPQRAAGKVTAYPTTNQFWRLLPAIWRRNGLMLLRGSKASASRPACRRRQFARVPNGGYCEAQQCRRGNGPRGADGCCVREAR